PDLVACNVDNTEPFQLFAVRTVANIHEKGIVKNLLLLVRWQVIKILIIHREGAVHVFAQRNRALLAVQHLEPVGTVLFLYLTPIHHVERQALHDGANDFITLSVFIDELPLILRSYIKALVIANDTFLCVVEIALTDFANSNFQFIYLHITSPLSVA